MRRRSFFLLLPAVLSIAGGSAAASAFQVIVHPGVKAVRASRKELASIFLGRSIRWKDGTPASPVDQSVRSAVRGAFSIDVLGVSLLAVQEHWRARIAAGGTPPPVAASDAAVLAAVAATTGAVGYVSAETALPGDVRPLTVVD